VDHSTTATSLRSGLVFMAVKSWVQNASVGADETTDSASGGRPQESSEPQLDLGFGVAIDHDDPSWLIIAIMKYGCVEYLEHLGKFEAPRT
jgi:hypothetical protein